MPNDLALQLIEEKEALRQEILVLSRERAERGMEAERWRLLAGRLRGVLVDSEGHWLCCEGSGAGVSGREEHAPNCDLAALLADPDGAAALAGWNALREERDTWRRRAEQSEEQRVEALAGAVHMGSEALAYQKRAHAAEVLLEVARQTVREHSSDEGLLGLELNRRSDEIASLRSRADSAEREVCLLTTQRDAAEETVRQQEARIAALAQVLDEAICRLENPRWRRLAAALIDQGSSHDTIISKSSNGRRIYLRDLVPALLALSAPALQRAVELDRAQREVCALGESVERVYLDDNCTCARDGYRCSGCAFSAALARLHALRAGKET